MEKGDKYTMAKSEVLEHFGILPTVKKQQLIIRQKGHPLGDWQVTKEKFSGHYRFIMEVT